ncbi:hypothetical protein [Halorarum salinum]|uniref:Uncharacterized protein n=1 Tax=Halorarum salinum TaxID=2743089 RepID=A0A7D5QA09_9EURY|nr:hypothetical protein [Halobaculum salinum]QLG61378.1 hypothetical protein HUG12_06370 [Halobaculum salinum]
MRSVRQALEAVPLRPASSGEPPAASWAFVALTAVYAGIMFWAAVIAATDAPPHVGWSVLVGVAVGAVAVAFAALTVSGEERSDASEDERSDGNDGKDVTNWAYALIGLPPVIFGVIYGTVTWTLWGDTTTAVVVQATLLLLVFGTYARPLIPHEIDALDGDELVDALDRHMHDWWGFAQLSASVVLAFGVGVAAGLLQNDASVGSADFVRLAVTTFLGVAALWAYALWKIRAVGARRRVPFARNADVDGTDGGANETDEADTVAR